VLVDATGINKSFAGVHALRDVHFELTPGEVHALVGENGAGKSTLINVISGAVQPDSGRLLIAGKSVEHLTPAIAKRLGVAAIRQQPALFPTLSVAENIGFAAETFSPWRRVDWTGRNRTAAALLERIGANFEPSAEAGGLSMAQQQLVEIAKALAANARILIMDEPTSALTDREVQHLFGIIRDLRAQGTGIIYISHRLEELGRIADRVSVLRDGQSIETRPMKEVDPPALVRMMVGRELTAVYPKEDVPAGGIVLETRSIGSSVLGLHNISIQVRAGEIVGLAGLVGAGRTELANVLFGITPPDRGSIRIEGREVVIDSPARAIELGLAYVPEDRRRHGVVLKMSVEENITLACLPAVSNWGLLDFAAEQRIGSEYARRLAVKAASTQALVETLSGGNQQKVSLSKWLAVKPKIIILDEPTQGIDVGAKAEVHKLMVTLARQGLGVLMISSELPEVLGMSDRVYVMAHGTIAGQMDRADASGPAIMELAVRTPEALERMAS
jgi:rhamnose transport system ATP-binding protein